jgi:hypothetical protein
MLQTRPKLASAKDPRLCRGGSSSLTYRAVMGPVEEAIAAEIWVADREPGSTALYAQGAIGADSQYLVDWQLSRRGKLWRVQLNQICR